LHTSLKSEFQHCLDSSLQLLLKRRGGEDRSDEGAHLACADLVLLYSEANFHLLLAVIWTMLLLLLLLWFLCELSSAISLFSLW